MKVNSDFTVLPELVKQDENGRYIEIHMERKASGTDLEGTGKLYKDGKVAVLKGFRLAEVGDAIYSRYIENPSQATFIAIREDKAQLSECTLGKTLYFKTCSAAASFVSGNNANGWVQWFDSLGNTIDIYRYPSKYRIKQEAEQIQGDYTTNIDTQDIDYSEREEETVVSFDIPKTLIELVRECIVVTGEYGKPSSENMGFFIETLGSTILEMDPEGIDSIQEYLDDLYCETDTVYRDGFEFYRALVKSRPSSTNDIISFIKNYSYKNDRVSTEVEIVDTKEVTTETVKTEEIKEGKQSMQTQDMGTDTLLLELFKRATSKTVKVELGEDTMGTILKALSTVNKTEASELETLDSHIWSKQAEPVLQRSIFGIDIRQLVQKASIKKAIILSGVPGTGKTKMAQAMAHIISEGDSSRMLSTTFGKGTSYSTFIGGIRQSNNGIWGYRDGIFTEFCKKADSDREHKYVLLLDELSRGNPEETLGEALTGMESRDTVITTAEGHSLLVPFNLFIIGTQNISDKSTIKLDRAVSERFVHILIKPQWTTEYMQAIVVRISDSDRAEAAILLNKLKDIMETKVNTGIEQSIGERYIIGTRAISTGATTLEQLKSEIQVGLIPIIEERIDLMMDGSDKDKLRDEITEIKSWLN